MNFHKIPKQYHIPILASGGLFLTIFLGRLYKRKSREHSLQSRADRKRQERDQTILEYKKNHVRSTLSQELKSQILDSDIKGLKEMIRQKKVRIIDVVHLFIERTIDIAYPLNLITEINFTAALEEARQQDIEFESDPEILDRYELFGIPISVKETYVMKGFDSTFGTAIRTFQPQQYDGIQVNQIRKARGIIFVRSNIPQLAMTFESVNHIYGRARNPWDQARSVGGSSGGEAALLASRCSVVGIGSDIAGSIRIPSAFCGVFGLKPGMSRQTDQGELIPFGSAAGQLNIKPSKGPMARSVADLEIIMKVLFSPEYYNQITDPKAMDFYWTPTPLKPLPQKQKLRIGVIKSLKLLQPPTCVLRAVDEAANALAINHEIIDFQIPDEDQIVTMFARIAAAEGGFKAFEDNLQGEAIIPEYKLMQDSCHIPGFVKKFIIKPLLFLTRQKVLSLVIDNTDKIDVSAFLELSALQKQLNKQLFRKMTELNLDGLICPGFGTPAIKHGYANDLPLLAMYTWIWNTVDCPVGSLPITLVKDEEDLKIQGHDRTWDRIYNLMHQSLKDSQGLPVNIQVITKPNQEEMCLRIMKEIDDQVQFVAKHKYPY